MTSNVQNVANGNKTIWEFTIIAIIQYPLRNSLTEKAQQRSQRNNLEYLEVNKQSSLTKLQLQVFELNKELEIIMSAVALLQAVGILYKTANLRTALTSTS